MAEPEQAQQVPATPQVPNMAAALPFDVLCEIFREATEKYKSYGYRRPRSVKACSLVCSTWRDAAQHELFNELTIHNHRKPAPEFYSAIAHNPQYTHIANYIKHIINLADAENMATSFGQGWPGFLSKLCSLRKITFNRGDNGSLLNPEIFAEEHRVAFLEMLRSPSFNQLTIDQSRNFPLHLVGCCPNLANLTYRGYGELESSGNKFQIAPNCEPQPYLEGYCSSSVVQLRELRVFGTCEELLGISRWIDAQSFVSCSQLRRLELSFSGRVSPGYAEILKQCNSVEELSLDFSNGFHLMGTSQSLLPFPEPVSTCHYAFSSTS